MPSQPPKPRFEVGAELERHVTLRDRLRGMLGLQSAPARAPVAARAYDVVVSSRGRVGRGGSPLALTRLAGAPGPLLSLSSGGVAEGAGGASLVLAHGEASRAEAFARTLEALRGAAPRRLLCVPGNRDDLLNALALRLAFDVPLCTWLAEAPASEGAAPAEALPGALLQEVLAASRLRLATGPAERLACERHHGVRCFLLPVPEAAEAAEAGAWLWGSLERGEPLDDRFERRSPRRESDIVAYAETPPPADLYRDFVPVFEALRRLHRRGLRPDFVIDIGASTGIWSEAASRLFPEAQFVLVEPLGDRYDPRARKHHLKAIRRHALVEAAVSDRPGRMTFNVPPDLYGASLLLPDDARTYQSVEVRVTTVDEIAAEQALRGRGLLKADVQCAEHLVLAGAARTLPQVDVILIELSLVRYAPEARTLREMLDLLHGLGFRLYDDTGGWRSPVDGTLLQKDLVFVRHGLFPPGVGQADDGPSAPPGPGPRA